MNNSLNYLPENINITITKADLIEFAQFLINESKDEIANYPGNAQKTVLNIEEAAEFCGLAHRTIYKKTSLGEIPHYKQAGKLFFKLEELEAWLTEKKGFYKPDISAAASTYNIINQLKHK